MARGLNKWIGIGNLGKAPILRHTKSDTAVCNFSVAINESYKDKNDDWVEKTEWVRIVAWGRLAEICDEYLRQGSKVYVEGQLQTKEWEDDEGNTRYTTEVRLQEMVMLDSKTDSGEVADEVEEADWM